MGAEVGGAGGSQGSLADRLAAAEAAVARQRVSELEAALAAAVERSDYGEAAALQELLVPGREALALAEVDVRLIGEAQAALEEERRAAQRAVQEAQQRDQARQVMEQSAETEKST